MRRLLLFAAVLAFAVTSHAQKLFDPAADPNADLKAAIVQAQHEHKNILMDVGGDWCVWCRLVDKTLAEDSELHALLTKNYVVLRVNMSKENENKVFLSKYPEATGYPAWYVLSPAGKLLKAEDTSELEATHKVAEGYNKQALAAFLKNNAAKR